MIVRILRGDRDARERLVATLAAGDADAERDWGLRVSRLVDAIAARAIEDGYLDVAGRRPVLAACSSPARRATSWARCRRSGSATTAWAASPTGACRPRATCRWPWATRAWTGCGSAPGRAESELAGLYERRDVAADEWLADQADDLSLGRMVDALGARAAELADVWNAWGRVRPALLAP